MTIPFKPSWQYALSLVTIAFIATGCASCDEDPEPDPDEDMGTMMQEDDGGDTEDDGGDTEDDGGDTNDMDPDEDEGGDVDLGTDLGTDDMGEDMDDSDTGGDDMGEDMDDSDTGGDDMDDPDDMEVDMDPGNVIDEMEPNGDPDVDMLQNIPAGDTVAGNISAFDPADPDSLDVDYYRVSLQEGDVFEWSIQNLGAGIAIDGVFTYLADDTGSLLGERYLDPSAQVNSRQAFIPEDADYFLVVVDANALQDPPPAHGGPTATYEIATSLGTLTPTPINIPSVTTGDVSDGILDAFSFTWSTDENLLAEITANRPPIESDLDSFLALWDVAAGEVIQVNDDGDSLDSSLAAVLTNGSDYYIVLDAWDVIGDTSYSLDVSTTSEEVDSEVNPTRLAVGDTVSASIAEGDSNAMVFDTDYYVIDVAPGETVKISVSAASVLDPRIDALIDIGFFGILAPVAAGLDVEGLAAITLTNPSSAAGPQEYFVNINDASNENPDDPNITPGYVGGAGYEYTLNVTSETLPNGTALTVPSMATGTYPAPGEFVAYDVPVIQDTFLYLSATSTTGEPLIGLLSDGFPNLTSSAGIFLVDTTETRTVLTRDAFFRGDNGATSFDFTLDIDELSSAGIMFMSVAEQSPNNQDIAMPQMITPPVEVSGETQSDAVTDDALPDYYSVTLNAGDRIVVRTLALAGAMADADTVIDVLDSNGDVLVTNDQLLGDTPSDFSALVFDAPAAGTYTIAVSSFNSTLDGAYVLRVFNP